MKLTVFSSDGTKSREENFEGLPRSRATVAFRRSRKSSLPSTPTTVSAPIPPRPAARFAAAARSPGVRRVPAAPATTRRALRSSRGGGKAHGPVVRSHEHDLPKKVRKLALRTALSAKAAEGKLIGGRDATLAEPKTSKLKDHFGKLGVSSALVIAGAEVDTNFARAAANIAHVDVLPQQGANVYDILKHDTLVLTRAAVEKLEAASMAKKQEKAVDLKHYDVVLGPHITEKSTLLSENNAVVFKVARALPSRRSRPRLRRCSRCPSPRSTRSSRRARPSGGRVPPTAGRTSRRRS